MNDSLLGVVGVLGHVGHRLAPIVPPYALLGADHGDEGGWARQHEVSETGRIVNIACNQVVNVQSFLLEPALLAKSG